MFEKFKNILKKTTAVLGMIGLSTLIAVPIIAGVVLSICLANVGPLIALPIMMYISIFNGTEEKLISAIGKGFEKLGSWGWNLEEKGEDTVASTRRRRLSCPNLPVNTDTRKVSTRHRRNSYSSLLPCLSSTGRLLSKTEKPVVTETTTPEDNKEITKVEKRTGKSVVKMWWNSLFSSRKTDESADLHQPLLKTSSVQPS